MALFQRKPQVGSSAPLYSIGAHKTILIIGLGNPSKEYAGTRHNIGFEILDEFAKANDFPAWLTKKDLKCELAVQNLGENRVVLCKPASFMNIRQPKNPPGRLGRRPQRRKVAYPAHRRGFWPAAGRRRLKDSRKSRRR
jgi:hypothetical protein